MDGNNRGLRLQLNISIGDPELELLHNLPWELLCEPSTQMFLALGRRTPIVRSLEVPRPLPPRPLSLPLRVLVVPTLPPELSYLDLEVETRELVETWRDQSRVEVAFPAYGGASGLRQALLERSFDILHFMGHGGFDPATGEGALFLKGEGGAVTSLSGPVLAALLKDIQDLRLVFINSLEYGSRSVGFVPDTQVARALLLGGLPAVVTMQFGTSPTEASIFSRTFYRRLAAGDAVESAVTEARQALFASGPDTIQWAAPVLYSRVADGQLFAKSSLRSTSPPLRSFFTKLLSMLGASPAGKPSVERGFQEQEQGDKPEGFQEVDLGRILDLASGPTNPYEVFLSYSHDGQEHMERVLELSNRLRGDGIDVWIDQYEQSPPEGWPLWSERRAREARFVLLICTKAYARRFLGEGEEGRGLGARWEGHVVVQEMYEAGGRNTKFIPVVLSTDDLPYIPLVLRGVTYYDLSVPDGYWRLYRRLTAQPERKAPPLGKRVPLPSMVPKARFDRPMPSYPNEQVKALAESLAVARSRLKEMALAGKDTSPLVEEIRRLRIEMREGGRLQPGDSLAGENYHLIEIVGRGGFATVWKAWDEERQDLVALKVLHGVYADDRTLVERFFRGARKMADLRHPGIVRILEDRLEGGGYHYFVMEFIAGGDLHKAVLAARLSLQEIFETLLVVGDTLSFAHSRGIVHRDVKPANILLGADGPKLTDFDLVHAVDTEGFTQTNAMIGTLFYTPPEVLVDAKEVTAAADVYSLAMTAIFALSGRELPISVIRRPERVIETLPCSSYLKDHLLRSISWDDPQERPSSMAEFCNELVEELRRDREDG